MLKMIQKAWSIYGWTAIVAAIIMTDITWILMFCSWMTAGMVGALITESNFIIFFIELVGIIPVATYFSIRQMFKSLNEL